MPAILCADPLADPDKVNKLCPDCRTMRLQNHIGLVPKTSWSAMARMPLSSLKANLRMTLPVLCLQNGARGQHVRVISQDRKKNFSWLGSPAQES